MLSHELAVGHRLMMRLAAEVDGMIGGIAGRGGDGRAALEAARLAGVVAHLTERYRIGVMAPHKLRGKRGLGETIIRLRWATSDEEDPRGSGPARSGSAPGRGQVRRRRRPRREPRAGCRPPPRPLCPATSPRRARGASPP
ncbi:MAG: hypothetical protein U1E53_15945 [Dongiaceae bacterium]